MQIDESIVGGVIVVAVINNRIDARNSGDLKNSVANALKRSKHGIVMDLSKVAFIDSTGLGALVGALKLVGSARSEFAVCGLNDAVLTLFKLTRMDKVFRTFATSTDAVAALAGAASG